MSGHDEAYHELEQRVHAALQTYSNVHRGSGHYSAATTFLFERARTIVLEHLNLQKEKYHVIFCSPTRCLSYQNQLDTEDYCLLSGEETGLRTGICAIAVRKNKLHKIVRFQPGGGSAKLVSREWILWAGAPDKFESGTPAIINIITLATALLMIRRYGKNIFTPATESSPAQILFQDELRLKSGRDLLEAVRTGIIGKGVKVPTIHGDKEYINLDNSASTLTFTPVWDVYRNTLKQPPHVQSAIVEEARKICAEFLNAGKDTCDIIFTSGTTESVNILTENLPAEPGTVILTSILEHSSNDLPWRMIPGAEIIRVKCSDQGFIDFHDLERLLKEYNLENRYEGKRIRLVALSGASNVLGTCNDLSGTGKIVHRYGAKLFIDGAQLVAHSKTDLTCNEIDFFAFSAHKIYAPFGSGVLAVRKGTFTPEKIREISVAGEENAAGIAALAKSLILLQNIGMDIISEEEKTITRKLLQGLLQIKNLTVYGLNDANSPDFDRKIGVFAFSMKGMMADKIAARLSERGIGIRAGCHCAHVLVKHLIGFKPALEGVQRMIVKTFPRLQLPGIARVSVGLGNTEEDIDRLIAALKEITAERKKIPFKGEMERFSRKVEEKVYR